MTALSTISHQLTLPNNATFKGSNTVQLTSCLFCLDLAVLLMLMNNSFTCFVKSKPVKTLMYNLSLFVNTINIRYALQFIPVLNVTNYSVASITLTFNLYNFFIKYMRLGKLIFFYAFLFIPLLKVTIYSLISITLIYILLSLLIKSI